MAVAFSCEHFPDLWDMVIAHTTHDTQLVLRLVCKSLRFKIDCHQARYLVISSGESAGQLLVTGPTHHIPNFNDEAHIDDEPSFWESPRTAARLEHTRILDICGFCPPKDDPDLFTYMHFPTLEVLHMTPGVDAYKHDDFTPYVPEHFGAETLVLFSNTEGCKALDDHWWFTFAEEYAEEDGYDGEDVFRIAPFDVDRAYLPDSVTKLVLNMRGQAMEFNDMYPFVSKLPSHVTEVVVSAPHWRDLSDCGGVQTAVSSHFEQIRLLAILRETADTKFTFVGFDRLDPKFAHRFVCEQKSWCMQCFHGMVDYSIDDEMTLALAPETRARYIEAGKTGVRGGRKRLDRKGKLIGLKEQVDRLMQCIEFLTKDEYVQRVGRETAEMELLEHPFPEDRECVEREYDWRRKKAYSTYRKAKKTVTYWHEMWEASE